MDSSIEWLEPIYSFNSSVMLQKREQQVNAFQNDPKVRVAVLSITAAGVALTLTAAATVWFAEMHWTPGLLTQAEDRVHRLGQKANVSILYFVARDTLDDILWQLALEKFKAVGEMVDGFSDTIDVHGNDDVALLDVSLAFESDDEEQSMNQFIVDDESEGEEKSFDSNRLTDDVESDDETTYGEASF